MEVFFNELAINPVAISVEASRNKVLNLLSTMKALREYDITVLRTYDGFFGEDLGCGYTFSSFLNDNAVRRDLKILLQSLIKNPVIPDSESYEAEMFINTKYETLDHTKTYVSPEGIAVSAINEVPTLSLVDFPHWQDSLLTLRVYSNATKTPSIETVLNVTTPNSLLSNEFTQWIQSITVNITLNSRENIVKVFPEAKYTFDNQAISDILSWYYDDKRFLIRVKELIEDIEANPFTGGKGKTEALGGTGGKASKRIVKKDRIIYTYTSDKIFIHQCRGHYDDK
ncbi:MAG TPA: Txe/YoeB family addiction module toxin [Cyclobacteriaceae bacterium]|jgi:toxin YoeB|nr:Txe/YoeB family addiction module toxin [Cyclobacteriaceae bacterium]